jgi:PPOX class probable F420-dependent enzyme
MLSPDQARFLEQHRVARLATADGDGAPHVVPVCFVVDDNTVYITIDEKPKQASARALKRLRNIAANPQVALVVDRYDDEDWSRLGWVMVRGSANILETGAEHAAAQALMQARYHQLAAMDLTGLPVIAIRIGRVASWGDLQVGS